MPLHPAARSRYRALSRIQGARAPTITPEPRARAMPLARSPTWASSASKPDSPGRVIFANPPTRTRAALSASRVAGREPDRSRTHTPGYHGAPVSQAVWDPWPGNAR